MGIPEERLYTEEDYENLPEDVRAELIDGCLIYNQAAPSRLHQTIVMEVAGTIREYIKQKGGDCRVYPAPFAVKLWPDSDTNIVEPDISVICDPDKLTDRGCSGAPDWIIEIVSPSNARHDYITKLNLYSQAGVREYWIIDPGKKRVCVYHMEQEHFQMDLFDFHAQIPVGIYEDFSIDFTKFDLS